MERFETIINGETYKISKWSSEPLTFQVVHNSGTHQIGRKIDGSYIALAYLDFAKPIPIEIIGKEIDSRL